MNRDLGIVLGILGFAFLTMGVYRITGAHLRHDPNESSDRGSFVLGNFVRSWFYWFVGPIERAAIAVGLSPTAFNVIGVLFGCAAGACFVTGRVTLGGWAILLGGAADVLDGRIARAQGIANEKGAFLDSTLDRFAEVGAFVGLVVLYRESVTALVVVATALGGSLLVSYARARGESLGVLCKVGVMQRAERLLLVGFAAVFDPSITASLGWAPGTALFWALSLVAVGTVGTAVYRTVWIARRLS